MKVIQKDNKTIICNYNPKENGIYKINFISNQGVSIYIGKTERTFGKRINEHIKDAINKCHCGNFQEAWNKSTKVVIEVIERLDDKDGINYKKIETQWIETYEINNLVNNITSYSDFFKKHKHASN